jgi:hypothetical protein
MFKPKRRRPVAKRTTRDESDDEDDNQNTTTNAIATKKAQEAKRKKQKRLKKASASTGKVLSFSIDEGDCHDIKTSKKKKKKKGGFGFGGMQTVHDPLDDDAEGAAEEQPVAPKVASGYSIDDLEKLKSQQKVYITEKQDDVPPKSVESQLPSEPSSDVPLPPPPTKSVPMKPDKPEEDFISFQSSGKYGDNNIVNGDDALPYSEDQNDDFGIEFSQNNDREIKEIDVEGSKWEDEVARRAGVGRNTHSDSNARNHTAIPLHRDEGVEAIAQIKQTIATTLDNLQQQELDLNSNMVRKVHDAHVADEDATKKELEVSTIGKSFECYQKLRSDLADWTGALRHLSEKIDIIEDALEDLYQDIGLRSMVKINQWEDDAIAVLKEKGLVDYIVGRQPIDVNSNSASPIVDEFGRDTKFMESLVISKRKVERRRRRKESADRRNDVKTDTGDGEREDTDCDECEDTDADVSDNELMDRGERRCALSDAIQVALDEMDEDFASLASLLDLFQSWQLSHPDDFRQCYASLAIVDFISVFARCEFCKSLQLLSFGEAEKKLPALDGFDWFSTSKSSNLIPSKKEGDEENKKQPLDLLIEKVCFASIQMCLKGTRHQKSAKSVWSYDPFSKRQTESLSSFCKSVLSKLSSMEKAGALAVDVCDYINDFLQQKAIVVIKRESETPQSGTEEFDAYSFACLGQLRCLRKLVINILNCWYPVFDNSVKLAKLCIADIMAFRFLPIVETLERGSKEHYEKAKAEFENLCDAFNSLGLFEREELMMISAPIRAYAVKLFTK